jgi:integrase/recombinase XerD
MPYDNVQAQWDEAVDEWLQNRSSHHTRRVYSRVLGDLCRSTGKPLWEITYADVASWVNNHYERDLSASTIRLELAAVSSCYDHAVEKGLCRANPAAHIPRPRSFTNGTRFLTLDETHALLQAVPRGTLQGLRDYALLLLYLVTGRRSAEVRHLRWRDFTEDSGRIWCRWPNGRDQRWDELPRPVWEAVVAYLQAADRIDRIQDEDYVFTALRDSARRLPNVSECWRPGNAPLSGRTVNQLLKRYARRAGLDARGLSARTLRHTAVALRTEEGSNVLDIGTFLGHANPAITARCLRRITGIG